MPWRIEIKTDDLSSTFGLSHLYSDQAGSAKAHDAETTSAYCVHLLEHQKRGADAHRELDRRCCSRWKIGRHADNVFGIEHDILSVAARNSMPWIAPGAYTLADRKLAHTFADGGDFSGCLMPGLARRVRV